MKFRFRSNDQVSGFLDKGTNVTGELEFAGTLRIDGNFHGSISTGDILIIGEHAVIHADIKVGEIEIHGQIFGNVEAKRRVQITETGRVRGDIHTPLLSVAVGALLDGRTRMAGDQPEESTMTSRSMSHKDDRKEQF
ncbi:MAG TPA: polymer-forming cytoskeletal protein [Terriglobia bacterium]|nr:polymer-forming cytoskeletal protein [Terriglobia bacterium]